ncbi:MAG: 23S rRNA (pseudouridine(1915)-N(3))-methyltransferase RlmH [Flavobacteriaceae bacterium]
MEILLLCVGKTDQSEMHQLIDQYRERLKHYCKFTIQIVEDLKRRKHLSEQQQKEKEGEQIQKLLRPSDRLILLDEAGKQFSSISFSQWLNKQHLSGVKRLVFLVGGPYGFSADIYGLSFQKVSLSSMTFSHQMVRLFFVEQLYRAHTILKNEPYHHR